MGAEFAPVAPRPYDRDMRRALCFLVALSVAPVWAPVWAPVGPARADTGPHREGEYGGVVPGREREAPARPGRAGRPPARGTLSWIGFEAKDGGAQVFFQSVAPFEVTQRLEGSTLVVHLALTRLGPNTWRQVDTRFFDSPLAGLVARRRGGARHEVAAGARPGIDVRIAFKDPKAARPGTLRTATEADGLFYAYLAFPAADAAPGADGSKQRGPTDSE